MPNTLPDFEKEFFKQQKENNELIKDQVAQRNENMMRKIQTYCDKTGYDFDEVVKKINNDEMFAVTFATDPARQNLYENLAGDYIKSIEFIEDFQKLPHSGKDALYIVRGSVINGKTKSDSGGTTEAKSIDFYWEYKNKKFYAFHKYTRESGGAQDNQYNDMKSFIENANNSANQNHFFFAIADGAYFDTQNGQAGISKIENLKQLANNQRGVYALRLNELYDCLKQICGVDI